jgi:alpha-amylase
LNKVKFCFGIHNHQPVGNFGWVIEEAYQKSYLPFLQLLSRYPDFRISLHFTGVLLEWVKQNHPELFDLIATMVGRNQIELLTGAFYEPILPAIPDRDKVGQIEMQTEFTKREFGVTPTGMWLAERVWEPNLPQHLSRAGVKYTILDDIHFRYAGLDAEDLDGYYLTEDQGAAVGLFPIAKRLRYTIPFADPEETVSYLKQLASPDGNRLGIYADDGEKFGVWPKTYEHCFVDGWLERFLRAISENRDWIEMVTFGEAFSKFSPRGRVYLPTASYSEMNEWAMPADVIENYDEFVHRLKDLGLFDANEAFVKGGYWRSFQTKYAESNQLHKRMLYVSNLLETTRTSLKPADYEAARRLLYAGQCNCPYWHGVFGGLYLPHLRGAVYQETIAAEAKIRRCLRTYAKGAETQRIDLDCDGHDEIVVTCKKQKAIISPRLGGALVELDNFEIAKNLVDVVGRRKEGYHKKLLNRHAETAGATKSIHDLVLVKEEGLERLLIEDSYRRALFVDHFLAADETLDHFVSSRSIQSDSNSPMSLLTPQGKQGAKEIVALLGETAVLTHPEPSRIRVFKQYEFSISGETITVSYHLTNQQSRAVNLHFGVELGLGSFTWPMNESELSVAGSGHRLSEPGSFARCRSLTLISRLYDFGLRIGLDHEADWWTHPLYTVSLSEGGFEKVFQGTILLPRWQFVLEPGAQWAINITLESIVKYSENSSREIRMKSQQESL